MTKNLNLSLPQLRRDFKSRFLNEIKMAAHPMIEFEKWFKFAVKNKIQDTNAFVLATAAPAARVLLMKGWSRSGITFFTNYSSAKGRQIKTSPKGEAVFFWGRLNRQIRISGRIVKLSRAQSLQYFQSRPLMAQIAACVSVQSSKIGSRAELEKKFITFAAKLKGKSPQMPENWGGYELKAEAVEFWQGRPNRLHDRILYARRSGKWRRFRIQP